MTDDADETPWLREQVDDEEILALFTDNPDRLRKVVPHLIARAREDASMESRLIEVLETAVDQDCDDSEASAWIAIILGEAGSRNAIALLVRCLSYDDDEVLQDAAGVALLRIGTPAMIVVMESVEEERGPSFNRAAYRLLGDTGVLEDDALHRRILGFLEERFSEERKVGREGSALEELAFASARLGHRALLEPFKRLLARQYNPVLEDAVSVLDENEAGVAFVPTMAPWEERYGWLFEDERDLARVERPELRLRGGEDLRVEVPGAEDLDEGDEE